MNKHRLAGFVFLYHFINQLIRPEFKIADFLGLQIIINGDSVASLNSWVKGDIFGTIENCVDFVLVEPVSVESSLAISQPYPRNNFVGGIIRNTVNSWSIHLIDTL
jgi:hypothetical protein